MNIRALKEKIGKARKALEPLNEQRAAKVKEMKALNAKGNFTNEDQQAFDALKDEINELDNQRSKLKAKEQLAFDELTDLIDNPEIARTMETNNQNQDIETWQNVKEEAGEGIKVVGPRASLAEAKGTHASNSDMADYLRGRVRGFTKNSSFKNAMDTSVDSALVPEPLSTSIIDKARAQSRVMQAGARTVDMTSKTLTIAKVNKDASVDWKAENASHSASDVGFEPLTFEAKTLIGSVKSSVELAEDSGNLASLVQDNLAKQIALKLDYAALMGSGDGAEPTGIINTGAVQMQTLGTGDGGPVDDYSEFSKAVQAINEANGNPNAVIYSPRTWGTMDRLTDSTGQPLQAPQSYQNLTKYQTSQIPNDLTLGTSNDASLAIVGDFSQLMIGVRTNIRLEVTRAGSDTNGSSWEDLQIWFRAYARYDVQLAYPQHFYVINGITPA